MPATRTARRPTAARRPGGRPPTRRRRPARGGRRTAERWWPALVLVTAVLIGIAVVDRGGEELPPPTGRCTVAGSSVVLTAEQAANAARIAAVAEDRGLHPRAVVVALATAQQESRLRNLDYGDRDSLGLFQQRPSQGWGTPAQVRDPEYAAARFYDGLVQVPGWKTLPVTRAAQAVQRSGFPDAYAQWEGMARAITQAIRSDRPGAWCS